MHLTYQIFPNYGDPIIPTYIRTNQLEGYSNNAFLLGNGFILWMAILSVYAPSFPFTCSPAKEAERESIQ